MSRVVFDEERTGTTVRFSHRLACKFVHAGGVDLKLAGDRAQVKSLATAVNQISRCTVRAAHNGAAAGRGIVVESDDVRRVCLRYRRNGKRATADQAKAIDHG